MNAKQTHEELLQEITSLRTRLEDAEATLQSIQFDEIDALVVTGQQGEQVFTLQTAERPYRLLIEKMQEGALTLNTDGTILYANAGFADMIGLSLGQVTGISLYQLVVTEDQPLVEALVRDGSTGHSKGELFLRNSSETSVPVQLSMTRLPDESSHPIGAIITNLTEQKRNEQIVADEKLARSILEYATIAIVVCNAEGIILRASQAAHQLSGQNLLQKPITEVFPVEMDMQQVLNRTLQGETVQGAETPFMRQDGQHFNLILTAGPLYGSQKEPLGCVITLTDITERKKTEVEVATLNQRLQRAMTETHHRVKNNLQMMTALIDMQITTKRESVPMSELDRIGRNVQALGVIHDILTEETKHEAQVSVISASEVLEKLIGMLQRTTGGRVIVFDVDDVPLTGRQASALALITNELVSNALKYSQGEVEISFKMQHEKAALEVCDDGPGFMEGFDPGKTANTGIELIENIARWDLHGETCYTNRKEGGARVKVQFAPRSLSDDTAS